MSTSSPTLPPPTLPASSSSLHHHHNNTDTLMLTHHQQDTTPSPLSQQQQRQQYTSPLSPRSTPRLPREDSSLQQKEAHSSPSPYPYDHNNPHNHNYSYNYKNENRPRSPYRDNYNQDVSFSATPHDYDGRRRSSAAAHAAHFYPDSNPSRPDSPRQQSPPPPAPYYRRDSAHLSRRSMSPAGAGPGVRAVGGDAHSRRYYPSSSSEPCREPCCVDTARAPYHAHSSSTSSTSSTYAAYPSSSSSRVHYYPAEPSRAPYSPDSPRTPAFSPSLHSSSSSSSPSSSTSPFTPTPSPATAHNPQQRIIFHDTPRKSTSNTTNSSGNNSDERMEIDQEESTEYQKSTKTTAAKTAAKPFKIPRPANSFMLYRAENGKKYPGLVATELSAKLGEAWRKEPQEVRDRYDEMAEQAKRDHALKYPDYKFAPVKRGTGKRALKLAAEAIANEMAEMDAAALLISMASMAPAPGTVSTVSISSDRDQRHYVPISRVHSTSVSATGTRPRAQRPFKVASLNKSIVPISNDPNVSTASIANASLSDNSPAPAHNGSNNENYTESANNYNGSKDGTRALANDTNTASQQSSRAYPQLSPPLILFREALARRSPQLASSLVAQIVINVWFGVTEELRERYEIMAETDPRFKDKSNYTNHSQISGTPTTASEAMMANQIAQLLKKAAAGEQLILPHSNKRKGAASTNSGYPPSTKLARIAPAPFSPPTEPAPAHVRAPVAAPIAAPGFAPPQVDLAPVPALVSTPFDGDRVPSQTTPMPLPTEHAVDVSLSTPSPSLPSPSPPSPTPRSPTHKTMPAVPAKAVPSPSPSPVLAEATLVPEKIASIPSWNDLAPAAMVPIPMASPNKRQTRASAALISMTGYSAFTSSSLSSSSTEEPAMVKKATPSKVQKTKLVEKSEEKVTPANRPIRRISRPPRYSA